MLLILNLPQSVLENGDVIGGLLFTGLGLGVDLVMFVVLFPSGSLLFGVDFFFEESDERSFSGSALARLKLEKNGDFSFVACL